MTIAGKDWSRQEREEIASGDKFHGLVLPTGAALQSRARKACSSHLSLALLPTQPQAPASSAASLLLLSHSCYIPHPALLSVKAEPSHCLCPSGGTVDVDMATLFCWHSPRLAFGAQGTPIWTVIAAVGPWARPTSGACPRLTADLTLS